MHSTSTWAHPSAPLAAAAAPLRLEGLPRYLKAMSFVYCKIGAEWSWKADCIQSKLDESLESLRIDRHTPQGASWRQIFTFTARSSCPLMDLRCLR